MSYQLREARAGDVLSVYHLICILEEVIFDYAVFEIIYCTNISNKDYYYLVAESDEGNITGFISCHTQNLLHHCGRVAEIQELFVDEKYRSVGIGRHLVSDLEMRLGQCVSIEVTAQNKRKLAHNFYTVSGFEYTHKKFVKTLYDNTFTYNTSLEV
jgi:PhnO protein